MDKKEIEKMLRIVYGSRISDELVQLLTWAMTVSHANEQYLPLPGETVAISLGKQKTIGLVFDRVWGFPWEGNYLGVPREISFRGATAAELLLGSLVLVRMFSTIGAGDPQSQPEKYKLCKEIAKSVADEMESGSRNCNKKEEPTERLICDYIYRQHGLHSTPVYGEFGSYKEDFPTLDEPQEFDKRMIIIAISNLDIVDEDSLKWEQVLEFRKDKDVRRKYMRFIHWLDKEMVGEKERIVQDEIAYKLDDYEQALAKHGIRTLKGTLQWALSGEPFAKSLGVAGGIAVLTGSALWAILAGSGFMVKEVAFRVWESHLALQEVEASYCDIAWVYEAKHKLSQIK